MNCSTPGLPVHHQLPEFTQTHVSWVHDAIQPSHPLPSPFPPAPNPSQHQSLFRSAYFLLLFCLGTHSICILVHVSQARFCFVLCFFGCMAWRILVPLIMDWIPIPLQWKHGSSNRWTAREVPGCSLFFSLSIFGYIVLCLLDSFYFQFYVTLDFLGGSIECSSVIFCCFQGLFFLSIACFPLVYLLCCFSSSLKKVCMGPMWHFWV